MAWTIILENEDKSIVASLSEEFYSSVDDLKGLRLLCYLDSYGDTVFNRLQMDNLIKDLQDLDRIGNNSLIKEIQLLAERCKIESHTYLIFYGD